MELSHKKNNGSDVNNDNDKKNYKVLELCKVIFVGAS